ncbi:hypothetical protein B807_1172 [Fructilactobacillus florum 2F]|nr:hypothetical protein B807_1172 [Fructilactobacillus florum 2F]
MALATEACELVVCETGATCADSTGAFETCSLGLLADTDEVSVLVEFPIESVVCEVVASEVAAWEVVACD